MNVKQAKIMVEVCQERIRQDKQWGGPTHDDTHSTNDWLSYVRHQIDALVYRTLPMSGRRAVFIKIAALAMAAVESMDRRFAQ